LSILQLSENLNGGKYDGAADVAIAASTSDIYEVFFFVLLNVKPIGIDW
jgi:hypothetical protein